MPKAIFYVLKGDYTSRFPYSLLRTSNLTKDSLSGAPDAEGPRDDPGLSSALVGGSWV